MKIYTLIQAGEGYVQDVFIGKNEEELVNKIITHKNKEIQEANSPGDEKFSEEQYTSLIQMLSNHKNWEIGRYELECIEPQWEEWVLIIAEF